MMKKRILVTGTSGVGKTSIAEELKRQGYNALDMDSEPGLCSITYSDPSLSVDNHDNANLDIVQKMKWNWDPSHFKTILREHRDKLTFYLGSADNLEEFLPSFDQVLLLTTDPDVQRHRLSSRTNNNYAQTTEVQDWLMDIKEEYEEKLKSFGATVIDTNKPLADVTQEIVNAAKNT